MELQEVADKLKVSKRTLENRLRKLNETQRMQIRSEVRSGNTRKFIYNDEALNVLSGGVTIHKVPRNTGTESKFTEAEHYKVLYQNALKRIDELKAEIKELKTEYKEGATSQTKRFDEAIKYFEGLVKDTQSLMNQQQQLHAKELNKRIEAPTKSILDVFRRRQ